MSIYYSLNPDLDPSEVARVFDSSGIRRPTQDLQRIASMFAAPCLLVAAWDGPTLVGLCRSLTDYVYCCYISDLSVARSHQRLGIGRELIQRTRVAAGEGTTLILISAPEAASYYRKVGFEAAENAFIIRRKL